MEALGPAPVGGVGRRPTRHGVHHHAGLFRPGTGTEHRRPGPGEHLRRVEQLVEIVDPGDAELGEHGRRQVIGPGGLPGVAAGRPAARCRRADLEHGDRDTGPGAVVGGQHQGAAVLEALDVGGDGADLGLVGEPPGEIRELEVGLVPVGAQCDTRMPIS